MHDRTDLLTYFTPDDHSTFQEVTGDSLESLAEDVARLPDHRRKDVLGLEKHLDWPDLNARGLHVFRSILAERVLDRVKREQGVWDTRNHQAYLARGLVVTPDFLGAVEFRDYLKSRKLSPQARERLRIIVYECVGEPSFAKELSVEKVVLHPGGDDQWELHVDTFHPTIKVWFYVHDVTLSHGPLHVVPGSHRNSREKLTWLHSSSLIASDRRHPDYDRRVQRLGDGKPGFSFRVDIGGDPPAELKRYGFPEEFPVTGAANTLVVADTSAFHRRGVIAKGLVRETMRASHRPNPFARLTAA